MNPKSIKIFLIEGEPDGLRTVELSNWIGQAIVVPRNKLKVFKNRKESNKTGIYFLFGEDSEGLLPSVYIGEAEILLDRLSNHDNNKDFWKIAVSFISKDFNLTKAHIKYLESMCLAVARSTQRFNIENSTYPTLPSLPESDVAEMEEFFINMQVLMTSIGYPVFSKIVSKDENKITDPIFICSGKGVKATGRLINDGFVVYKDSMSSAERSKTAIDRDAHKNLILKLIQKSFISKEDKYYIFNKDYVFNSPTAAAEIVLGHPASGWERWKTQEGKTLKEFYSIKK